MPLPESKRFPIDVVVVDRDERPTTAAPAPPIELEDDPVLRVTKANGWEVVAGDRKWVVTVPSATGARRVVIEETGGAGGGILRVVAAAEGHDVASPGALAERLRANARVAHAAFGLAGDPPKLVLSGALLRDTADDDEIVAVVRSAATDGEPIRPAPLESFDRSRYKIAPTSEAPGVWEAEILRLALSGTGVAYQITGARADTLFRLAGNRTQRVHVLFDRAGADGRQILQMISVCGPAKEAHFRMALGSNPGLAFAAIALAKVGAEENLVVVRTQLAATADPEEILVSLSTLAQIGDRIEQQITGGEDSR